MVQKIILMGNIKVLLSRGGKGAETGGSFLV